MTEFARLGFLAGRNDPADIPSMIRLFSGSSIMARSVRAWTNGDALIMQVSDVGKRIHEEIAAGHPDAAYIDSLLGAAEHLHFRLGPLEEEFSTALGAASRRVTHLLLAVLAVCGISLVCLGIAIVRGVLKRNARMSAALRVSQVGKHPRRR